MRFIVPLLFITKTVAVIKLRNIIFTTGFISLINFLVYKDEGVELNIVYAFETRLWQMVLTYWENIKYRSTPYARDASPPSPTRESESTKVQSLVSLS